MGDDSARAITLASVKEAHERISDLIHRTPVITSSYIDSVAGLNVHFKCETFQRSGAFKFRGAANAVFSLTDEQAARGVITHSSGNHGGALALAAKLRDIPAAVVVPDTTPDCKKAAIRGCGAALHLCEASMSARESVCARLQAVSGATFVPPYNDAAVMAGQGTIALELLEQVPQLDAVIVPVSGGGMISGIATAVHGLRPEVKVFAAEPLGANGMADVLASKAAGRLVELPSKPLTIADGLQGRLGDLTWPVVRDLVSGVVPITDADIVAAMRLCFERLKLVVEPSGAAGLAALLSPTFAQLAPDARHVAVILCGGNIDFDCVGFWDAWRQRSLSAGKQG